METSRPKKIGILDSQQSDFISMIIESNHPNCEIISFDFDDTFSHFAIASEVKSSSCDLLYINIESCFSGFNKSSYKTIELIFWLRIKMKYFNLIICYGFLSVNSILRIHPNYVVIHAPGNYYWRLGDFLPNLRYVEKITEKVVLDEYKKFLMPLDLDKSLKHSHADKWAVWRLASVYYRFLNGNNSTDLSKEYDIDIDTKSFSYNILNRLQSEKKITGKSFDEELAMMQQRLLKTNKKILLIDDNAHFGWAKLFPQFLSCQKDEFSFVKNVKNLRIEDICEKVVSKITDEQFNLILLDLRLKDELGRYENISDLSGYKLLLELKNIIPGIPIIIITASRRILTIKALSKLGIWGIWNKEGVDSKLDDEGFKGSMLSLMQMVLSAYQKFTDATEHSFYELDYRIIKNFNSPKYNKNLKVFSEDVTLKTFIRGNNIRISEKLSKFDVCILDTNLFLQSEACGRCDECRKNHIGDCTNKRFDSNNFVENYELLHALADYFYKNNGELIIHNHVYSEILQKSKPLISSVGLKFLDKALMKTANYALKVIEKLISSNRLSVAEYDSRTYDNNAYADPLIVDYIISRLHGLQCRNVKAMYIPKSVLLVTNDTGLFQKATALKGKVKKPLLQRGKYFYSDQTILILRSNDLFKKLFN